MVHVLMPVKVQSTRWIAREVSKFWHSFVIHVSPVAMGASAMKGRPKNYHMYIIDVCVCVCVCVYM